MVKNDIYDIKRFNPFVVGSPILDEAFYCPRKEDDRLILKLESSKNNIYIAEERRIGKTSLVRMALKRSKAFIGFYIDVSNSTDLKSLINQMLSLDNAISLTGAQRERFSHLRERFRRTNKWNDDELKKFLFETLQIMKNTSTKNKKPIIIFDEFQVIKSIGEKHIRDTLRNYLQEMSDLRVVFLGSVRSELSAMFTNQGESFYGAASRFALSQIPINDYYDYVTKQLLKSSWLLDRKVLEEIYKKVNGITEDIQRILAEMYDIARIKKVKNLNRALCNIAIEKLVNDRVKSYERDFAELSIQQKRVLRTMALHDNVPVKKIIEFSSDIKKTQFVKETVKALSNKMIISEYSDRGVYQFYDPFFKIWLGRKFDTEE